MTRRFLPVVIAVVASLWFASAAFATVTEEDESISAVSVDSVSSTAVDASGVSMDINFTVAETIPAEEGIVIYSYPSGCVSGGDCNWDFSDAVASGIPGEIDNTSNSGTWMSFSNSSALTAGSYTLSLAGVDNPEVVVGVRVLMYAADADFDEDADVRGTASDPTIIGTPLAKGMIKNSDGDAISTYGNVSSEDWNTYGGFQSDAWGFYVAGNPGFVSGDTVRWSVYPDIDDGLVETGDTFAYSGSTVTLNITPSRATKTLTGTVAYEDGGAAVTTASVFANGAGRYANTDVGSDGSWSLDLAGGEYQVCLGDLWADGVQVEKDWYMNGDTCQYVEFDDDETTESEAVSFEVEKADARVTATFKNPDGTNANGWVSMWTEGLWFGGQVNDGAFSAAVVGGRSQAITALSRFIRTLDSTTYDVDYNPNESEDGTYWDVDTITVDASGTLSLGVVTLKERNVDFTATVIDGDGAAVAEVPVDCWQEGGGWTNAETNSSGVAVIKLYPGEWSCQPSLWNEPTLLYAGQATQHEVESGDSIEQSYSVEATTVDVTLVAKVDGVLASGLRGWANCWSPNGNGVSFGGQVEGGEGSFGAVGGTFSCNLWVDDPDFQGSSDQTVTFVDGVDSTLTFDVVERTATVQVFVKTAKGVLAKDAQGWAFVNTNGGGWSDKRIENGSATIRVAPGTYNTGAWFDEGSSYISSPHSSAEITVTEGQVASDTVTVFKADAELIATLVDSEGAPVTNAWVGCGNWQELDGKLQGDFDGGRLIDSGGQPDSNGVAVVKLVKGHEYNCWAGAQGDLISPEEQELKMLKRTSAELTFTFRNSTASISGEASLGKNVQIQAGEEIDRLWCGAWSDEGYNAFSESLGSSFVIPVVEAKWNLWCGTEILNGDGTRTFYNTDEDITVKVKDGDNKVVTDLVLTESPFAVPESESFSLDATKQFTVTLGDGSRLSVPERALADSGTVTITAAPEMGAVRTMDVPFGFPWNFEAYDADGQLISGDFNTKVNLDIPFDADLLREYNLTAEDLLPKVFDPVSETWVVVDGLVLNEVDSVVSFSLAHFSKVGLLYNINDVEERPKKVRNLRATKIKKKKATINWKKPKNAVVTRYVMKRRVFKRTKADSSAWKTQKKRVVKNRRKKVQKKLKSGKTYQVRVKACNSVGCGPWKTTRFTTK